MTRRSKTAETTKRKADAKQKVGKTKPAKSGMVVGRGWRLTKGETTVSATLLAVHDLGDRYIAIFKSVA
jgi:hypothetical protein